MRVAFFGSPALAVTVLQALVERHTVALVVAQPDKPAGRGQKLRPPPAATKADELGLALAQPAKLKGNTGFKQQLSRLDLDVAVTAAYGKILPPDLLDIPRYGFLNVHASLLPRYRGAAPIQWALINGETETGITIMQTDEGMDTGPIRLQKALPIDPDDTAATLAIKLGDLGAKAILEALGKLAKDNLPSLPQDDAQASHARLLRKEDGMIRWTLTAEQIYNRYRGVILWPGSYTYFRGETLKVHKLTTVKRQSAPAEPGAILAIDEAGITVAAGSDVVLLREVQPAGKGRMRAREWANGYRVEVGERFE